MANAKPFRQVRELARHPGGRPTLYEPRYCQLAIDYMGKGYSLTALAGHIGVGKDAVYEWMTRWPEFADAIKRGRAARVGALETKLLNTSMGVGVTAAIFALKNADPDEWQDRYNTETNINVKIERLPDDELMRIAASGRRPLTIEHDASANVHSNVHKDDDSK